MKRLQAGAPTGNGHSHLGFTGQQGHGLGHVGAKPVGTGVGPQGVAVAVDLEQHDDIGILLIGAPDDDLLIFVGLGPRSQVFLVEPIQVVALARRGR